MKKCYECEKELKFWEGYYHPALGKKEFVCSKCFDSVKQSMENYRNFILSHFKQAINSAAFIIFSKNFAVQQISCLATKPYFH